jgi:hypothetical protein
MSAGKVENGQVEMFFDVYGTHKYPCIWITEVGSGGVPKFILLDDPEDAIMTLKEQVETYLKMGMSVQWKLGV